MTMMMFHLRLCKNSDKVHESIVIKRIKRKKKKKKKTLAEFYSMHPAYCPALVLATLALSSVATSTFPT